MTKYIFLDIDGVLWTVGWSIFCNRTAKGERRQYEEWCPAQTSNLQWVLDQAKKEKIDVKIVISSMWRLGRSLDELKAIAKRSGLDPDAIVGVTPWDCPDVRQFRFWWWGFRNKGLIKWWKLFHISYKKQDAPRGHEIQAWMDANGVKAENICIIDDDSDMAHLKHRLVKTDSYDGIGFRGALKVCKMLGIRN